MGWTLLLLLFITYCSGSSAPFTLSQPPSHSASQGDTARLSCTMTGLTFGGFGWYQQKEGKSPKYILWHKVSSSETSFGSEVSGNFSASTDNSRKVAYLTITNVLAKDEAAYYCEAYYSNSSSYVRIFGGGTQLTVSGGPRSPPTVNLYCPPKEQMASEGKATLVCSITDFSPSPMETTWEVGGTAVSNGVQTTKPIKDNGKYMTSSYMTTTASDWERGDSFTCKVRHEGIDYVKTVSQSQCP